MSNIHGGDIYDENGSAKSVPDFSANINPLGMPPSVRRALIENIDDFCAYPDPKCRELRLALSKHHDIPPKQIVCGNGAADLIYRLVLAGKPQRSLLIAPGFSEYEQALRLSSAEIEYHILEEENNFTLTETLLPKITEAVDMLFLCSPNNPTGMPIDRNLLFKIARRCEENSVLLVIDECFNEFLERGEDYSFIPFIGSCKSVVVLKAFTKIYAMAGLRLGYALCSDEKVIAKISETLQPWSVSTPAQKCGIAALSEVDFVIGTKLFIAGERAYLSAELEKLGAKVFPSLANFILFKSDDFALEKKLRERGILIRSCANFYGLGKSYYRIAVKKRSDNERLIAATADIMEVKNG